MERAHLFISGRVQGVFFRANTRDKAQSLGINGWVKNLPDGRVEVLAEGEKKKLKKLVRWCHSGSSSARVDDVEINWEESTSEYSSFRIKY